MRLRISKGQPISAVKFGQRAKCCSRTGCCSPGGCRDFAQGNIFKFGCALQYPRKALITSVPVSLEACLMAALSTLWTATETDAM